jgi:hypothetical protein
MLAKRLRFIPQITTQFKNSKTQAFSLSSWD